MNPIEIRQNWPDDFFRIEIQISNICNYQCWYCYPGSNEGNYKWPDYDILINNLSHLMNYYMEHTNKKRFQFGILGGEVTHWKRFIDFIRYFKENYNVVFNIHTNASKKIDWWKQAAPYLDHVSISHHIDFSNKEHNREVADLLYEHKKIVDITVLMDPNKWNECNEAINYFLKSKYRWTVRGTEIYHQNISYTDEQKEVIKKFRHRTNNPLYFLLHNKKPTSKTKVVDEDNTIHKVNDNYLLLNRLNDFNGWECNIGKDWIGIKADGRLSGSCSNPLYDHSKEYNMFDVDFTEKFQPNITTSICTMTNGCWCAFETNMPKRKLATSPKRIIPIYVN